MKTQLAILFIVFSILTGTSGCQSKKAPEMESKDNDVAFKTDTVQLRNYEQELQFTGQVAFDQKQVDRVFSAVSGNILEVNADLGAYVQKNQVLAKIQSADVSQYLRDYNTAKANFDIAKKNSENIETLYKTKFSSENDLITSKKQLEIAQSELNRSSEVLKLYGGASAGSQPVFTVKSPVSGYIVERNVNANTQIRSDNGNSLFTVSSLSDVWVMINIYESDIQAVKVGQEVNIVTLAYPDKVFKGIIQNISQVIDNDSKVLQARVVLPNPSGILKPDMFCTIKLHIEKPEKLLAVNPKSVIFSEDKYFVVQVLGKEKYKIIPVDIIKSTSKFSYVKANLKDGDQIITEGSLLLFNEINQ